MVLTVSFVLSLVSRACCHHRRRDAKHRRQVDIGVGISGPHDFAVRFRAVRLSAPKRPPHPAPNVRDDRETPLKWAGTAGLMPLICPTAQVKCLRHVGTTGKSGRGPKKTSQDLIVTPAS
jgi:hypothetical protein